MPKFKDAEGNEVEAFTSEEVEARLAEERTKLEEEHTGKLSTLQTDLEAAQQALKEAEESQGDKDQNLSKLRNQVKRAEDALKEQGEKWGRLVTGYKDRSIKNLARGNEEMEKKIRHHFDETLKGVKAETDEEVANKVRQAYQLSQDTDIPDPLMSAVNGGVPSVNQNVTDNTKSFTPEQKALGSTLGISEDDYQKYENDPRRKQ